MRLGQAETTDDFTGRHAWQVLLLLLLAAIGKNRIHAQRTLHRGEAAQTGIAALQLLADQAIAHAAHAGAAVFRGNGRAKQAQTGNFRDQFPWETRLVEAVADDRQHLLVDETAHGILHHAFFVAEQGADVV